MQSFNFKSVTSDKSSYSKSLPPLQDHLITQVAMVSTRLQDNLVTSPHAYIPILCCAHLQSAIMYLIILCHIIIMLQCINMTTHSYRLTTFRLQYESL